MATALALAALGPATAPALAADMKSDYGSRVVGSYPAVPVPAPIPIPDTFSWYIRGDAGYSLKSQGTIATTGTPQVAIAGPSDHDGPFSGSFAFGRYVTPSLRAELGLDLRNQQTITKGSKQYNFTNTSVGPADAITFRPTTDTHTYLADREDTTNLGSHTLMANLYYDVKTGTAFTPYFGAGAGVSLAVIKRRYNESAGCVKSVNSSDPNLYVDANGNPICSPDASSFASTSGHKTENAYGPALAFMAGTAIDLRPGVAIDLGYRMMWQGSTPSISMGSVTGDISKLTANARTDHELRMGLRWNVW